MSIYKYVFCACLLLIICHNSNAIEWDQISFPILLNYINNFYLGNSSTKPLSSGPLGTSVGSCNYDFIDYVGHRERRICLADDRYILHLQKDHSGMGISKPPLMVKCLLPENYENATQPNELRLMSSVKEIVALLQPIGNSTKRHEPGSCVVVVFFTSNCLGCSFIASYAHKWPRQFPSLTFGAIDSLMFPSFNTEFGIVGLPTILLFHQGRPVIKVYGDGGTFATFVTRHTGIKPVANADEENIEGPLPTKMIENQHDSVLVLAWIFILICVGNYFSKSRLCQQIVEMVKRNWRESEAQLEQQEQQ